MAKFYGTKYVACNRLGHDKIGSKYWTEYNNLNALCRNMESANKAYIEGDKCECRIEIRCEE